MRLCRQTGAFRSSDTSYWIHARNKSSFSAEREPLTPAESTRPKHATEHRLYTAAQLVEDGRSDTLGISHFAGDVANRGTLGADAADFGDRLLRVTDNGVTCFTPSKDATIGEEFTVRELADQESWKTVTVVTSRAHAFRAHHIFEQCVGDEVNLVHSDPELHAGQWAWHIIYENAAPIKAL